eukprot:Skav234640  [mRNA]  locus=scaffold1609:166608:169781:+ [translate_table: standard]
MSISRGPDVDPPRSHGAARTVVLRPLLQRVVRVALHPSTLVTDSAQRMGAMRSMMSVTHTKHSLVESFWDATLFAGLDEVGVAGSLMIFFGVTVSFCLQLIFCWIVVHSFLPNPDLAYDLDYLREWRVLYGHSVYFYDETSGARDRYVDCGRSPDEKTTKSRKSVTSEGSTGADH